jgi:hypothetical protein
MQKDANGAEGKSAGSAFSYVDEEAVRVGDVLEIVHVDRRSG